MLTYLIYPAAKLRLWLTTQLVAFHYWCEWFLEFQIHPRQHKPIFFEPISATAAIFISLAVSAASFGAQLLVTSLLAPKKKPEVRGKLTGDITLTDSIWGATILRIFGAAPGDGDNFGGMEVGGNIIWSSDIRKIQTQIPGGGGGHQGKGGHGSGSSSTIQINYKIDLAVAVGAGRLKLLRLKFNEDTVFGGTGGGTGGPSGTRYEAEDTVNTLTGTAVISEDTDCSNGRKVTGIGPGGTLTFNFDGFDSAAYIPPDPPDPGDPQPFYIFDISYKSDGDRQAYVRLNGTGGIYTFPDTGGGVGIKSITRRFDDAAVTLQISNPSADAPEIDCLDISVESIYENYGRQTGIRDANFPPEAAQDNILLPDPNDVDTNAFERYNGRVVGSTDGVMEITLSNGASLSWYEGTEDQPVDAVIAAALGATSTPAFRGTAYGRISNLDFTQYGSVPSMRWLVENLDTKTVSEICTSLALEAGLLETDLDLSVASDMKIRGYVVESVSPPAKVFEEMALIKNLAFTESSAGKIIARDLSDRTTVAQIRRADLGAYAADGESEPPMDDVVSTVVDQSTDLVRELELQFYNPLPPTDFGTDRAKFVYPFTDSRRTETKSVAALLSKDEALAIVRREVQKNHLKAAPAAFNLPYRFAGLEPGDCVEVEIENALQKFRLEEKTGSAPGVFECSATNEQIITLIDDTVSSNLGGYGQPSSPKSRISVPANSIGTILDIPPLVEAQNGKTGVYVAACPRDAGGSWSAATVYRYKGGDWQQVKVLSKPAVIGTVVGVFGEPPESARLGAIDTDNSFTVDFYGKNAPGTVGEDALLDGANPFVVGSEVVNVRTWTRQNDYPNRWTATNIIRQVKTTEKFTGTHVAGERCVMLSDAVEFVPLDREEVGIERVWKFVTSSAETADAAPINYIWTGENLIQGQNIAGTLEHYLTLADGGKTFYTTDDKNQSVFYLPAPVEETTYNFAVLSDGGLRVWTTTDFTILYGSQTSAAGGFIESFAVGATITLRFVAGIWVTTTHEVGWSVS